MGDDRTVVIGRLEVVLGNPFRTPEIGLKHFSAWHSPSATYLWCGAFGLIWSKS